MASKEPGNISIVYAHALYDVAKEQNVLERVEEELVMLQGVAKADVQIRRFLETPTITLVEKRKVLEGAFKDMHAVTLNFMLVALEHGRVPMLGRIIQEFHALRNVRTGVAEMVLSSARKFENAEMDALKKMLEKKLGQTVVIKEKVQPELLGGFILAHGNQVWDASKVQQLGRLTNKMEEIKASATLVK